MNPEWTTFFSSLASVAAALLALLFVSFQIARERWIRDALRKRIASQTLMEFLTVVIFSLVALMPLSGWSLLGHHIDAWQSGGFLVGAAGFLTACEITYFCIHNYGRLDSFGRTQLRLQPIAIFEYGLILLCAAVGWFVPTCAVMTWLLISGSWETWQFFSELD